MIVQIFALSLLVASCTASKNFISGIERLPLNAERSTNIWTAYGVNTTGEEIRVSATVPGGIYSDLEDNGIFSSAIYHEYNDMENRWVGRMNWTFTRNFTVTDALLQKTDVTLVCEGLDTISEVFINGISVGKSKNMFARYIFDVKSALKLGENSIRVAFRSPVEFANAAYIKHVEDYGYPVVPESLDPAYRGENKAQMIRKMQSSFSWDWGPSYPNSGIWKNIYIEGYNGAVIRDVMIFLSTPNPIPDETAATQWNVTARVYYDSADDDDSALLTLHRISSQTVTQNVNLQKGRGKSIDIFITESGADTKLWWPNGYGDQNLYWYNISLSSNYQTELSTRLLRIGFRTVELVEDFVKPENEELGREFYFAVNGAKMYSKGSNSIPLHVLPERITESQTEWVLRAAKMSHQNMIRVWGGGMYETEEFYDWADEYGIFIWEDFMFACAMYPGTEEFLENVRHEVETQVKRLQCRPSLVMWAGNNENEVALRDGWYGARPFETYYRDYILLYIDTIKSLTEELDPSRKLLSSSPTNGKMTEEEGWIAQNPGDLRYGDIHFYDTVKDNWDWRTFRKPRYASEYGYQSFPHYETLSEVADNISSWTWDSQQMQHRQHHPGGQREIRDFIKNHFPFPKNYDSTEAFPYMLYMNQLIQSMGQKTQTESYRRLQDKLNLEDGTGHNMGALYWQLNDIWEGCSWASIETTGRWKLQMYFALKFFAPVLASPYKIENGDVVIELISDLPTNFSGILKTQVFKLSSKVAIFEENVPVQAEFLSSKEVHRLNASVLERLGCDEEESSGSLNPCVVYLTLPGTPDNFLFLQYPRNKLALKDPQHQIKSVSGDADGKTVHFTLGTEAVAPFVYLNVRGDHRGYFSDNGFLQVEEKQLTYYSENGLNAEQFMDRIQVMSLFNVTVVAEDFNDYNYSKSLNA